MKHTVKAVILTTAFLSSFSVLANTTTGETFAYAEIIFSSPLSPISFDITPQPDLVAGPIISGSKIAGFSATSNNNKDIIAVRWGDNMNVVGTPQKNKVQLIGKSTGHQFIGLMISDIPTKIVDNKWHVPVSPGKHTGTISTYSTSDIVADVYPISMAAAIWTA